jgi:hypothetical protein
MADNDASHAGMEEIQGHINILSAKLKNLGGDATSERATGLLEDMQDYYDRAVQLRTYRITSLEEELKDKDTKITEATKKAARSVRFLYVMILAVVLVVVEATVPGTLEEYVLDPRFLSHIGTALVAIVFSKFVFK